MNKDFSPIEFYEKEVRPKLNRQIILSRLNPKRGDGRLILDCPHCGGKEEAYVYDNSDFIICNRKNNCTPYNESYITYLNNNQKAIGKAWFDIVKPLAAAVGSPFPEREYTHEESLRIEKYNKRQNILNDFQCILVDDLNSEDGETARKYLENRGFKIEEISAREFGFFHGNPEWIKKRLINRGYSCHDVEESGILNNHRWHGRITYPIRDHHKICDFWARDITGTVPKNEKYLRMNKQFAPDNAALFGLDKAGQDIILFEGHFDQLMLSAYGIKNGVSLGGCSLWDGHPKKLEEHRVKKVTVVLDDDKAGNDGIAQIINRLLNTDIEVYVVPPLLLGGLDPDEYVIKYGADRFNKLLGEAIHGFRWIAQCIAKTSNKSGSWKDAEVMEAYVQAKRFEQTVFNPDFDIPIKFFCEEFQSLVPIDAEDVNKIKENFEKKAENIALEREYQQIEELLKLGAYDEARQRLLKTADNIKAKQNSLNLFQIQFLNERPENFLLVEAPPMPSLVTMNEKGIETMFLPRGIVGSIVGAGSIGKTHWLTQLAIAIATQELFLGEFKIKETGYAALALGENKDDDIHRLLRKTVKGFYGNAINKNKLEEASERLAAISVAGINASFIDANGNASRFYYEFLNNLVKREPKEGFSCIILDPASRFMGPNAEKDNAAATLFISLLEQINQALRGNPTVLFGHHMSKNAAQSRDTTAEASRGASAIKDGVRWQCNLESVEERRDLVKMKVTKTNHTKYPPELILYRGDNGHLSIAKEKETHDYHGAQLAKDDNDSSPRTLTKNKSTQNQMDAFDKMAEL